jgi:hypothetical protein
MYSKSVAIRIATNSLQTTNFDTRKIGASFVVSQPPGAVSRGSRIRRVSSHLAQFLSNDPLRPRLVSVRKAATMLGIGLTSTWGLITAKRLAKVQIGRRTLVTVESIDAFIASLLIIEDESSAPRDMIARKPKDGSPTLAGKRARQDHEERPTVNEHGAQCASCPVAKSRPPAKKSET